MPATRSTIDPEPRPAPASGHEDLYDLLAAHLGRPIVPRGAEQARFDGRIGTIGSKQVALEYRDAAVHGLGDIRYSRIAAAGTSIHALMLFPADPAAAPVFACEFVVFGELIRAGVVDLQPLGTGAALRNRTLEAMRPLAEARPELRAQADLPDWCRDHFTPHAVFAARMPLRRMPELMDEFARFCEAFATLTRDADSTQPLSDPPEVRAYKQHHIEHTPGLAYLSKVFGADWTRDFLREGMYR